MMPALPFLSPRPGPLGGAAGAGASASPAARACSRSSMGTHPSTPVYRNTSSFAVDLSCKRKQLQRPAPRVRRGPRWACPCVGDPFFRSSHGRRGRGMAEIGVIAETDRSQARYVAFLMLWTALHPASECHRVVAAEVATLTRRARPWERLRRLA
jgi:hypothetical protein